MNMVFKDFFLFLSTCKTCTFCLYDWVSEELEEVEEELKQMEEDDKSKKSEDKPWWSPGASSTLALESTVLSPLETESAYICIQDEPECFQHLKPRLCTLLSS